MRLLWYENSWDDYMWWQSQDKKTLKRINLLIRDMQRSPFEGIGKPEPLKENLSGWWGGFSHIAFSLFPCSFFLFPLALFPPE